MKVFVCVVGEKTKKGEIKRVSWCSSLLSNIADITDSSDSHLPSFSIGHRPPPTLSVIALLYRPLHLMKPDKQEERSLRVKQLIFRSNGIT